MPFLAQDVKSGRLQLMKNDPVMKRVIKLVGPFSARTRRNRFASIVDTIVAQQISVAAASAIRGRLDAAVGSEGLIPSRILEFDVDGLREIGFSRPKASYVLDLAEQVHSGEVDLASIHRMDDEAVIEELIQVKGIGRWTAQIFLMFSLGRIDVLPVDDVGLKNAIKTRYDLAELPDANEIERIAEKWRPYATVASWYLWKSLELE